MQYQNCSYLVVFLRLSEIFYLLLGRTRLRGGVEQSFGCPIVQNRQDMQSMRRSMDWTMENNLVDGWSFCAILTVRRGGHTPFVQARAETSDTNAEAVEPDAGFSWEGHSGGCVKVSGIKMRRLVGLSAHSAFH